ncbi:uncharacterized protein [Pseudorca crassidens]|uniref:uncharacterized protein n=1 Tax=Pseudorca crassidens TaxID=82174 RepID=UPI00352F8218
MTGGEEGQPPASRGCACSLPDSGTHAGCPPHLQVRSPPAGPTGSPEPGEKPADPRSCPGTLFTQLIQLNASHYMAWCSLSCEGRNETSPSPYLLASSPGPGSLQCCSGGPLCLELNQLASGENLLPRQKAVAECPEGLDFCELKRSSLGYTAGRSQACVTGTPRCHRAVAQPCYQECCQASASGSCLQLDENLRFNGAAPGATRSPLPWTLAGALLLFLRSAVRERQAGRSHRPCKSPGPPPALIPL